MRLTVGYVFCADNDRKKTFDREVAANAAMVSALFEPVTSAMGVLWSARAWMSAIVSL